MTTAGPIAPIESEAASGRQRAHVAREKWEESWVAEQRNVTDVVASERRELEDAERSEPRRGRRETLEGLAPESYAITRPSEVTVMRTSQHGPPRASADLRATPKRSSTAIGGNSAGPTTPHVRGMVTTQEAPALTRAVLRDPLPRSAFWRDKDSIDVAMRLADPDRGSDSVIAQLRQWLREAGASLRKVFINGRIWSASSETQSSHRARRPNEHTYI